MRKATKTVISLAVVLIAGLNLVVPAFAQDPFTAIAIGGLTGASGAGLFGSMAGMTGIYVNYTSDPVNDAMWDKLNPYPVHFSGTKHEASGTGEDVWDYITVDIGDWLDAQSDFIVNFAQTNNVSDNDSGTVSVAKSYYGYQFDKPAASNYTYGDQFAYTDTSFSLGPLSWVYELDPESSTRSILKLYESGVFVRQLYVTRNLNCPIYLFLDRYNYIQPRYLLNGTYSDYGPSIRVTLDSAGSVSWTSGNVNTSVFDNWDGARVKIPHSISQLTTGWTVPEFMQELDRIWYGAGEDNIVIEDYNEPVPPVPVPGTPLGEVPFDDWVDLWGQGIYEQLENQSDALDFIGSNGTDAIEELENIDENIGALEETAESIDTNIGIGNGILGGIRSLAQSAVNYLEGIAEHVGELVEEIVEGTETLIAGILNQIPQAFSVIFGPIKQASSIWHYVVEWITSIGAPFQFIWSMASGTSYYVILPVYASLAAAVVLAFFKRFGR